MFAVSKVISSVLRSWRPFLVFSAITLTSVTTLAQDTPIFRIGTGATIGNYFPIGGIIASSISKPVGSRDCDKGGSCGVDGLLAATVSTNGSVANIRGMVHGILEAGLAQADVAYWAATGQKSFRKMGEITEVRSIASLYPEAMHLVVSTSSGIRLWEDLHGARISLGPLGSGTRAGAQLILEEYGMSLKDATIFYMSDDDAYEALLSGRIDAFFTTAGIPSRLVDALARQNRIILMPIEGEVVDKLIETYPFFSKGEIEVGTYRHIPPTPTVMVTAQLLMRTDIDEELAYGITKALWHESTQHNLRSHPIGNQISIDNALKGLIMPLHPGAVRYYREIGLLEEGQEGSLLVDEMQARKLAAKAVKPATETEAGSATE